MILYTVVLVVHDKVECRIFINEDEANDCARELLSGASPSVVRICEQESPGLFQAVPFMPFGGIDPCS